MNYWTAVAALVLFYDALFFALGLEVQCRNSVEILQEESDI